MESTLEFDQNEYYGLYMNLLKTWEHVQTKYDVEANRAFEKIFFENVVSTEENELEESISSLMLEILQQLGEFNTF